MAHYAKPVEPRPADEPIGDEYAPWIRGLSGGRRHMDVLVPGVHCAGCINKIETALKQQSGVTRARVNLSTRRISLDWNSSQTNAPELIGKLESLGYEARPFDPHQAGASYDKAEGRGIVTLSGCCRICSGQHHAAVDFHLVRRRRCDP